MLVTNQYLAQAVVRGPAPSDRRHQSAGRVPEAAPRPARLRHGLGDTGRDTPARSGPGAAPRGERASLQEEMDASDLLTVQEMLTAPETVFVGHTEGNEMFSGTSARFAEAPARTDIASRCSEPSAMPGGGRCSRSTVGFPRAAPSPLPLQRNPPDNKPELAGFDFPGGQKPVQDEIDLHRTGGQKRAGYLARVGVLSRLGVGLRRQRQALDRGRERDRAAAGDHRLGDREIQNQPRAPARRAWGGWRITANLPAVQRHADRSGS